jgi:tetratricopeptide (TPR) repeat protein
MMSAGNKIIYKTLKMLKFDSFARNILLFLLALVLMASCNTIKTIPVEVAYLPSERLPQNIQSLTLVNRAANNRFRNFRADSLQQFFYQRQFKMDTVLLDTQATDTLLIALGDILFESGRFDVVIPENRFLSSNTYSFVPSPMPWNEVDTLTRLFNTDAVLSLDFFRTNIFTQYEKEALYDQQTNNFFNGYFAHMKVAYEALFRIYYPAEKEIIKNIVVKDTLYWEDADTEIRPLFNRFTTVKAAMIESGIHAALKFSGMIAPDWRLSNRSYFFKGHPLLEEANTLIQQNDWNGAADLWRQLALSPASKSQKSKAEFNLALAYEMFGDIDEAIKWGLKSYETMFRPITYNYLERLNIRKQQIGGQ